MKQKRERKQITNLKEIKKNGTERVRGDQRRDKSEDELVGEVKGEAKG